MAQLTPWFWISGLQNCEKLNFCCFKLLSLWSKWQCTAPFISFPTGQDINQHPLPFSENGHPLNWTWPCCWLWRHAAQCQRALDVPVLLRGTLRSCCCDPLPSKQPYKNIKAVFSFLGWGKQKTDAADFLDSPSLPKAHLVPECLLYLNFYNKK